MLFRSAGEVLHTRSMRSIVIGLNLGVAALVVWLHVSGTITGVTRAAYAPGETYAGPAWLAASNGIVFAATGFLALVFFTALLAKLFGPAFRYWWVSPDRA